MTIYRSEKKLIHHKLLFYRYATKRERMKETKRRTLRSWVFMFFRYALDAGKSFYWEWDDFMITIRRSGRGLAIVFDRYLKKPPYIDRDMWVIPKDDVLPFLVEMYDRFPSSLPASRNAQASRSYLSFRSFISMILNRQVRRPDRYQRLEDETAGGQALGPADIFPATV